MIKLIVSDFDGTLLPYGKDKMCPAVMGAIKELISKGVKFAVSSGRTYNELLNFMPEVKDDIYFICCDGAVTVKGEKVIFRKPIKNDVLKNLVSEYKNDYSFAFCGKDTTFTFGGYEADTAITNCRNTERYLQVNEEVYKILSHDNILNKLNENLLRCHFSDDRIYEYVSNYADKGISLADLQMSTGISKFETLAMGDSANDIVMMKYAKYSVCVGDRCEELKKICAYRFSSSGKVIETLLKNNISL